MRVRLRRQAIALALWLGACGTASEQALPPAQHASGAGASGIAGADASAPIAGSPPAAMGGGPAPAADGGAPPAPDPTGFDGPRLLSQTGLYAAAPPALAAGVRPYTPLGELWADGADKLRWIYLPPGSAIDSADMDAWQYPIGTKLWKEFALGGVRLETRLIEKLPDGRWRMVAYAWNAEQTEATAVPLGVIDAAGTQHDIPDLEACKQCHEGVPDRVLGFSALQLTAASGGATLATLVAEGLLTVPPATALQLPGDELERTALAYLHANCGHCHRPDRKRAEREISVYFWQETDALANVRDTVTYQSLIETKSSPLWLDSVSTRMRNRGGLQQMPPLATTVVDPQGSAAVEAWLTRLRSSLPPRPALPAVDPSARCEGVEKVFEVFERAACRTAFCHGAGVGELDFTTPEQLHDSLVGVRASGEGCSDLPLPRVQPGDPANSLLWIKLQPGPPCGKIMPPAAVQALSPADLKVVSDWIAGCAP